MRTFIAIPVPDEVKNYASRVRRELEKARADVKWVEYENYHLTIKFLGESDKKSLTDIKARLNLAAEASPAFSLSLGELGFFPNRRRPRVIWLDINGEIEKAAFLGGRVDAYLSQLGYEEEKNHRFHLTLGRIRSERGMNEMNEIIKTIEYRKRYSFSVDSFSLMESVLSPNGAVYSALEQFTLNG